jgi:hypothetical protein
MTLAEKFDQWAEQYKKEGRQEGETLLLQRLLTRRFGPLPSSVVARIAAGSVPEIETWGDRVLDAKSLDEVFRP